ncbi:MAG: hypothetical protein K8Q99_01150 [Acholeplasmataceae bacterium]|nr:hypothetical protein [Acholeplasmataceae bacterium]
MEFIKSIASEKSDYDDLENYLISNDLLDERKIWYAGYNDKTRDGRNAVAANLFSKIKNLEIVCIKDDVIYFLKHKKNVFDLSILGKVEDKYRIKIYRNLIYPSIEIIDKDGKITHIQAVKNKKCVHEFKKLIK